MSKRSIVSQLKLIDRLLRLPGIASKPLLRDDLLEDRKAYLKALEESEEIPRQHYEKLSRILDRGTVREVESVLEWLTRKAS